MMLQSAKQYLKIGGIIIIAGIVLIYGLFRSRDFLEGPSIVIESPENGATLNQALLSINGQAKHIAFITLNDRQIFVDESGALSEELLLQHGYNVISIKATDRFNRKVEKRLELIYQ